MSIVSRLINNPESYSIGMLQHGVQAGTIPPYIGIPLIQQKVQEKQEMQNAQNAGPMPTVAGQVMAQARQVEAPRAQQMPAPAGLNALRSNLPEKYAHGGIVALAGGGDPSDLVKMLMEGDDEDDEDYNDAIRGAMKYIEAMRDGAMHMPEGTGYVPRMAAKEATEGVTVKVGDMPARTVEHHTKEVTKPAGIEGLLALVQQKESGGRRYGPSGELLTSPKGAMGEMQVMPGTARDPGYGIRPAREGDHEDIARVGREYFTKMLERYNDPKIAAVAYNWGPGNTDKWLMAGADPKDLPAETRKYIQGFAEGGIASIPRFEVGGLTAAEMMRLPLADLMRMVQMSEPGAADELERRRVNRIPSAKDIGPARMSGTPPMDLRNPTVRGGASAAAEAAKDLAPWQRYFTGAPSGVAPAGSAAGAALPLTAILAGGVPASLYGAGLVSGLDKEGRELLMGDVGSDTALASAIMNVAGEQPPAGVAPTPGIPRMPGTGGMKQTYRRGVGAGMGPTPENLEAYRQQREADIAAAQAREDLEGGQAMERMAQAGAAPAAPAAEPDSMATLRKYIQEGMAEAKSQKEIDKYMALLQAGLGMMGGSSRYASENIGRGALMGAQAYQEAAKARAADQRALLSAQLGLERYEQLGKFREAQTAAAKEGKEAALAQKNLEMNERTMAALEAQAAKVVEASGKLAQLESIGASSADIAKAKQQMIDDLLSKNKRYQTIKNKLYPGLEESFAGQNVLSYDPKTRKLS